MIQVSNLQVTREGKSICTVEQLAIAPGQRVAIVGSNGSGKTTLLRVLAGLEQDYQGSCQVESTRLGRTYLHQHPFLFRGTVLANVRYGERGRAGDHGESNLEAITWLKRLGIEHLANRTTQNLSGGEIRRVALARALACRPRLLLLDEPLAELDPNAADTVCQLLHNLPETTIVISSPIKTPLAFPTTIYKLD